MPHPVKCFYCGKTFDRDKEEYVSVPNQVRRYAHKTCADNKDILIVPKNKDKEELEEYIKRLFKMSYVHPNIVKQINEYIENDGFTYSGIHKTLYYYFDILRNKPFLANPTIAIVGYVYPSAKEYYRRLYEAHQVNKGKNIKDYANPESVVIKIRAPEREPLRRRDLFSFLDEEVIENGE